MLDVLQILTVLIVVFALIPALAHVLELPGKRRLTREAYYSTQPIYYPGFAIAGFSEPIGIVLTIILLVFMPVGSVAFWLTLVALLGLIGMQAVYWLLTHPVNKFWLAGEEMSRAGARFFSLVSPARRGSHGKAAPVDWRVLRDRWEYSHVMRAALAIGSLIALIIAIW